MSAATTIEHTEVFPAVGYRARRWARVEHDLESWLATPEGCFTTWCAQQQIAARATPPLPPLDSGE